MFNLFKQWSWIQSTNQLGHCSLCYSGHRKSNNTDILSKYQEDRYRSDICSRCHRPSTTWFLLKMSGWHFYQTPKWNNWQKETSFLLDLPEQQPSLFTCWSHDSFEPINSLLLQRANTKSPIEIALSDICSKMSKYQVTNLSQIQDFPRRGRQPLFRGAEIQFY